MAYPIRTADVRRVLEPLLGTRFVTQTALCEHAAELMRRYTPGRTTLEEVTRYVRDGVFGDLYELLGKKMLLQLENGIILKIRLQDVDVLADEAMGVLLDAMGAHELPLDHLRAYAMGSGSLSAMRVMLQRYDRVLSAGEKDVLRRIIRENYPSDRYSHWLA